MSSEHPETTGNPLDPIRRPGAPAAPPLPSAIYSPGGDDQAASGTNVPDPDPANTPGLDAGGGVMPGDTPPIESGTTGLSTPDVKGPSAAANAAIPIGIIAVVGLGGIALLIGRLAGVF